MWDKSGKLDLESGYLNSLPEKHRQFLDSLFYNVDLINKIKNSLPLKANGSLVILVGTGLGQTSFPYFWDQLTPLSGEFVWGLRPNVAAVD